MKKIKKTKIIATIGPSSSSSKTMEQMMLGGVDVFRINFSHAKHNEVKKTIKLIREIDKKLSLNTAIIADLQGPKLRIGKMEKNSSFNDAPCISRSNWSEFILGYITNKNITSELLVSNK